MKRFWVVTMGLCVVLYSCGDDDNDLPSFDERQTEAIEELIDELTEPVNGWRLDYQPTPDAGLFFILLDFDDNGQVTVRSDLADNDGQFFEQTIPYRVDNALGLELILETYAVFHYMFEQDRSTFGAEFEFIFQEQSGSNLVFESKSDISNRTQLVFIPAAPDAEASFSRELAENLNVYEGVTPQIFGGDPPIQHLVLNDQNISVFWSIDISKRVIEVDIAGEGTTVEEISGNPSNVAINHTTGYTLLDGKLILMEPFSFTVGSGQITISELTLTDFSMTGPSLCALDMESTPVYDGQAGGAGSLTVFKTLFDSNGQGFQPMEDSNYGVNVIFIFNEEARSLAEEGSIQENFPNAVQFVLNYGLDSAGLPANAVGLVTEDESGNQKTYLREFEPTTTIGNKVQITLTNDFYYSETPEPGEEESLIQITDEIFGNGEMYTYDVPSNTLTVFRLFNPCNRYEVFLVQ